MNWSKNRNEGQALRRASFAKKQLCFQFLNFFCLFFKRRVGWNCRCMNPARASFEMASARTSAGSVFFFDV